MKKNSLGNENVYNKLLTKLTINFKIKLLNAINFSWSQGIFPNELKTSILIPILKPGKDKTLLLSYRPFSLLYFLAKLI